MKISVISPESIKTDELKALKKALETLQKQIRSNQRYAAKLNHLINKLEEIQNNYNAKI